MKKLTLKIMMLLTNKEKYKEKLRYIEIKKEIRKDTLKLLVQIFLFFVLPLTIIFCVLYSIGYRF